MARTMDTHGSRALSILRFFLRLAVPSMRQVRLGAYTLVVFGVLAFVAARSVRADIAEVGLGVGHALAGLEDLTGGAYRILVNGAEVHWASGRTEQDVAAVLDRYEALCETSPSALGAALVDVPRAVEERLPPGTIPPANDPARSGVFRAEQDGRGMVACFVRRGGSVGGELDEVRRSLEAIARAGDLASLGRFRYVFAERSARGGTRVITLWSDGSLDVGRMFPASGDAPGTDSSVLPRPSGSRRTLSAAVVGFPAAIRIYESTTPPADLLANASTSLRAAGFEEAAGGRAGAPHAVWVRKDGAEVFLTAARSGERSTLSMVETGGGTVAAINVEKK
jgi:hypothetical protein